MKLTVLADIHGNLSALEAVLEDIEAQAVDTLVCLGDVASYGPLPCETPRRVQDLGCPVILGNADAAMLTPPPADAVQSALISDIDAWCAAQLSEDDRDFIRTFKRTVRLELGGLSILCFHGSPRSYNDEIHATTPDEVLGEYFETHAPLMFGGHTHLPLSRRYQQITLVNPGSVGLPYELVAGGVRSPAWAEYALVDLVWGQPRITFRRVSYDLSPLLAAVRVSRMSHAEAWAASWSD